MNPFDNWYNRRRNPFDSFNFDDQFYEIFKEMERMMERTFKDFDSNMIEPGKPFVYGYNIHVGSDGKPEIQEFGSKPTKQIDGSSEPMVKREPLTDMIEGKTDVSVTVEIPGVEKDQIDLRVYDNSLDIKVNDPNRNYHRNIDLPCDVQVKTTKATYKNGILDIQIKKKKRLSNDNGQRISID